MKKKFNFKGVSVQTWVRTGILLLALVNQALVIVGITDKTISADSWASIASYALTAISAVWSWWKNNSFTEKSQSADGYLNSIKSEIDELENGKGEDK